MDRPDEFIGLKGLRKFLKHNDFEIHKDPQRIHSHDLNLCNWYALRKISRSSIPCETNRDVFLMITPSDIRNGGLRSTTATASITAERNGIWYQFSAFGILPAVLMDDLPDIEVDLLAAWNSFY